MKKFKRTTLSVAAVQALMVCAVPAWGQTTGTPEAPKQQQLDTVVVTGQRAALESAQRIKQNSDEIVDSIVADDIGKLPDRSVSEVLQRIVGVSMDRVMARGDPAHFSVEGSGVIIRGLTYVASQLNGRESFSANGGRGLSFEDVPPELMAGVDVYKNPSAEQTEGAIGGLVNLRTALPFDYKGFKAGVGIQYSRAQLGKKTKPSASGLLSNTWNTDIGKIGLLVDVAYSESATRTDGMYVDPYFLVVNKTGQDAGGQPLYAPAAGNHWFPKAIGWRTLEFDRKRQGTYVAAQWQKDTLSAALTYFRSKYNFYWDESSIDSQADPYNAVVSSDATWGTNGNLIKGTITDPVHKGIPFNADTRFSQRNSKTQESTLNIVWTPNDKWRWSNDIQFIESTTAAFDSTVATGINMPKETVDLSGSTPRLLFDSSDLAALADPSKYYWAFTMEHLDKSRATQKAWKSDVRYNFDDPVLHDLRFGVRLSDRDANNIVSSPSYNWKAVTQTWQAAEFGTSGELDQSWDWHPIRNLAYLSRFNGPTQVKQFTNFMNGRSTMPSLVLPTMAVAANYPTSYQTLHSFYDTLCTEYAQFKNPAAAACPVSWSPAPFNEQSPNSNKQHEKTNAAYAQLRFGLEEKYQLPIDGNVGLRVVQTKYDTTGYKSLVYTSTAAATDPNLVGTIPTFNNFQVPIAIENKYTDALPSMNLRWKTSENTQMRFAYAKAVSRPDFSDLQPSLLLTAGSATTHSVLNTSTNTTQVLIDDLRNVGSASGNPVLKPVKSDQFDLTAEWYPAKTTSVTVAAFNKRLKDVIVNQVGIVQAADTGGKLYDFAYSTKVNGAKGWARGLEFAVQHYFNGLPGVLAGLGVQANFTYVDSKQTRYNSVGSDWCSPSADAGTNLNLFVNGCDTNGQSYGSMPLPNLSRKAFNFALLYDHGPVSARLAYAWRGKYLNGVAFPDNTGPNQTNGLNANPSSAFYGRNNMPLGLPIWTADYGQLDLGVFYKVTENFQLGFEGQNLTDSVYKQLMQQHVGMMGRTWFSSGPRYTMTARYTY